MSIEVLLAATNTTPTTLAFSTSLLQKRLEVDGFRLDGQGFRVSFWDLFLLLVAVRWQPWFSSLVGGDRPQTGKQAHDGCDVD